MNLIVGSFLLRLIRALEFLLFVRAISSWFIRNPANPIYQILVMLTEPFLSPIRSALSKMQSGGFIDFSILVGYLLLEILSWLVVQSMIA
ncbi:MAG TPA: YggT family protein [Clostridia bacterium]|nr:YggT family protein [Clostridia bacterium]